MEHGSHVHCIIQSVDGPGSGTKFHMAQAQCCVGLIACSAQIHKCTCPCTVAHRLQVGSRKHSCKSARFGRERRDEGSLAPYI